MVAQKNVELVGSGSIDRMYKLRSAMGKRSRQIVGKCRDFEERGLCKGGTLACFFSIDVGGNADQSPDSRYAL